MELLAERSQRQRMGAFDFAQSPDAPKETLGAPKENGSCWEGKYKLQRRIG